MKFTMSTCNHFYLKGNIVSLHVYGGGNAMNVLIGVNEVDDNDFFVSVKYFVKDAFDLLTVGMPVIVHGHIGANSYKAKDGEIKYKDNNDLIADVIEINETKKASMKRRVEEAYK